jgi:hypothetical protein
LHSLHPIVFLEIVWVWVFLHDGPMKCGHYKRRKSCVQFITFQNPAHKALTFPWKCNLKFPCSSPISQCHDVNEDWFWHQVFQFSTSHNWISNSLEPLLHLL